MDKVYLHAAQQNRLKSYIRQKILFFIINRLYKQNRIMK